jgi:hypothetical protein
MSGWWSVGLAVLMAAALMVAATVATLSAAAAELRAVGMLAFNVTVVHTVLTAAIAAAGLAAALGTVLVLSTVALTLSMRVYKCHDIGGGDGCVCDRVAIHGLVDDGANADSPTSGGGGFIGGGSSGDLCARQYYVR